MWLHVIWILHRRMCGDFKTLFLVSIFWIHAQKIQHLLRLGFQSSLHFRLWSFYLEGFLNYKMYNFHIYQWSKWKLYFFFRKKIISFRFMLLPKFCDLGKHMYLDKKTWFINIFEYYQMALLVINWNLKPCGKSLLESFTLLKSSSWFLLLFGDRPVPLLHVAILPC